MTLRVPVRALGTDLPNHLAAVEPHRVGRAPPMLLLGLLLLCLARAALMAWKLAAVCPDGVAYIHLAEMLDQGKTGEVLRLSGLNPLPIVLVVLHRAGLDWGPGGEPVGRAHGYSGCVAPVRLAAAAIRPARGPGRLFPLRRPQRDDPLESRGHSRSDVLVLVHFGSLPRVARRERSAHRAVPRRGNDHRPGFGNAAGGAAVGDSAGGVVGGAMAGARPRRRSCRAWPPTGGRRPGLLGPVAGPGDADPDRRRGPRPCGGGIVPHSAADLGRRLVADTAGALAGRCVRLQRRVAEIAGTDLLDAHVRNLRPHGGERADAAVDPAGGHRSGRKMAAAAAPGRRHASPGSAPVMSPW